MSLPADTGPDTEQKPLRDRQPKPLAQLAGMSPDPAPKPRLGRPRTRPPLPEPDPNQKPHRGRPHKALAQAIRLPPGMPAVRIIPEGCPIDFPPESEWHESGLVAAGADLTSLRLVRAYSRGIFPWYTDGPILWWSPDPRCVLFPDELHIARSLARTMRRGRFSFSINRAFIEVMRSCAKVRRPGQKGTWLNPSMIAGYLGMHRQGMAHSVECWQDGKLVGGLYGVALGRVFFGESMFHLLPDASKAALVVLIRCMKEQGFVLLDCQQNTPHMLRMGAREIPRSRFLELMREYVQPSLLKSVPTFSDHIPDME